MTDGPIIFWWGSDLRILDGGRRATRRLEEGGDPVAAILEAMTEFDARPPARIVYHPEGIKTHLLDGGRLRLRPGFGGRARLRRELIKDFPALAAPDTVWSVTPASPGSGLVMYLDLRSRLPALVAALARAGRRVEGAWPLPLLVEAGPDGIHRGSLSLVATADRTLVAWFNPAGGPGAEVHTGENILDSTVAALRGARARFDDGEPSSGWLAIENGPWSDALRQAAEGLGLTDITLPGLLERARLLPSGGPADFLAPPAWWKRRKLRGRIAAAAGVLLAAIAAEQVWAGRLHRDQRRRELAQQQIQRRLLETAKAAGLARQNQIEQLAGELGRLESAPQYHYELLMALARSAPDNVVLESVSTQGAEFTISGRAEENAVPASGLLPSFYRALAANGTGWTLAGELPASSGPRFTLTGRFRPPAPQGGAANDPAGRSGETVAQWASRLQMERSRLPSAAAFDAQLKRGDSRWIVSSESADRSPSGEVRHYVLNYDRPKLDDWSSLVDSLREFCAQPGLTIDRLTLTAAPDGAAAFLQAGLSLSVRLRP